MLATCTASLKMLEVKYLEGGGVPLGRVLRVLGSVRKLVLGESPSEKLRNRIGLVRKLNRHDMRGGIGNDDKLVVFPTRCNERRQW